MEHGARGNRHERSDRPSMSDLLRPDDYDFWTGETEPPRYTCVDDVRVLHEGNEIEDCEACLPRTSTRTEVGVA